MLSQSLPVNFVAKRFSHYMLTVHVATLGGKVTM